MSEGPRRLLLVSISLNKGGAERFVSTLLVHLDRERVAPSLCLLRDDIAYPLPDDVPCAVLNYHHAAHLPRAVNALRRLIAKSRPQVVLSNGMATAIVAGLALRWLRIRPTWIARIDNNPVYHDTFLRRLILKRVFPRADQFVVNSRGVLADLGSCYPLTRGRTRVIHNPTDFARLDECGAEPPARRAEPDLPVLISVGRFFAQKRLDLLLDAFALVRKSQRAELWLCGDGPERKTIESRIARLGLGAAVRLLGHCPNPHALMRQAAVYLLSSDYEGLPNALIEAQGLGLPAVSTRCPHGPQEIIDDGKTGLLTPVGEVKAFAGAIAKLLSNAQMRKEMGQRAKTQARKRFDVGILSAKWEQAILARSGQD